MFCHTFERIFHANLDAHLNKLLKQKKFTNLGQSISSIFFKAKINFKDAPTLGKQSTIDYELAKKNFDTKCSKIQLQEQTDLEN